jgi:hypothetical protein
MIFDFILYLFSSLLIIYSIHNLYNYLKNTYTTKKTKDLVAFHLNKYQDILETVNKTKKNEDEIPPPISNDDEPEFISTHEKDILHNSLLELIKDDLFDEKKGVNENDIELY